MKAWRRGLPRAALGALAALLAAAFAATTFPVPAHAASSVRLMVDPGHGGKDPGAVAGPLQEKDSSLRISKMVVAAARRQGWDVASTRSRDTFVGLVERPQMAARWKANALVSIHSNSMDAKPHGSMTIYRTGSSARLGNSIMSQLAPLTSYPDIGNRADVRGLAVLRHASMPGVIVELLSVTSGTENRALRDPAFQQRMAEAIVRGIAKYYNVKYYPPVAPKAPTPEPEPKPVVAPKPAPAPAATAAVSAPAPAQVAPAAAATNAGKAERSAAPSYAAPKASTRRPTGDKAPTSAAAFVWQLLFR